MDFADIHYEIPNITEPLINWEYTRLSQGFFKGDAVKPDGVF